MRIFCNPEFKKRAIILSVSSLVMLIILACINALCAALFLAFSLLFFLYDIYDFGIRYKRIKELSVKIEKILNGHSVLEIDDYFEGELSILKSEIYKMTVRMREQAANLKADKIYLTDSIADISHQLRTPLTSINMIVSFLKEENISQDRKRELFRELSTLLSRIEWLIMALLKISKIDAGTVEFNKEKVNCKKLLQAAVIPVAVAIELKEQEVHIIGDDNASFEGDFSWCCEAILNILKNCMEHTPEGGSISIEFEENAIYTQIIVSDTGEGMDEADIPHLFERFYKGKNSLDSSFGIGLALSRMIITSQNGTVKAKNNSEGGAQFIIRLYKGSV